MGIDYDRHPELVAAGRELDRALWPVIDRIAARLGLTRADVLERIAARRAAGAAGSAGRAEKEEAA
jgi:predicted DNA-binding ribbon-helix-helix protein